MKNLKISHGIMLVVLIPLLAMVFFASNLVLNDMSKVNKLESLSILTVLSTKMSNLVHEQQKERGATAGFLGSKGQKFRSELISQRQVTNQKRQIFHDYIKTIDTKEFGQNFNGELQALIQSLGRMDQVRSSVDQLSISTSEAISYYTELNGQNLALIDQMAKLSPDPAILSHMIG